MGPFSSTQYVKAVAKKKTLEDFDLMKLSNSSESPGSPSEGQRAQIDKKY